MKYLPGLVLALAGYLGGCGSSQAAPKSATYQAVAESAVQATADAWNLAARSCLAAAGDSGVQAHQCEAVLQPIHDEILAAGTAIQIWSDVDQNNVPCMLADIAQELSNVAAGMQNPPQALHDAAVLANQFSPSCQKDAGK